MPYRLRKNCHNVSVSSGSRKRRSAAPGVTGGGGALVDISLQKTAKTATRVGGRSEPDLDLIKQVEQVTTSDLEGPAWRFAGIPSVGITHGVEVFVFLIWQLLNWLLFGCKNSQEWPRTTICKAAGPLQRRSGMPPVKLSRYRPVTLAITGSRRSLSATGSAMRRETRRGRLPPSLSGLTAAP